MRVRLCRVSNTRVYECVCKRTQVHIQEYAIDFYIEVNHEMPD